MVEIMLMKPISTILLPTRPQPDTIVAIFLLQTFGNTLYSEVATAQVKIMHSLPPDATFDSLLSEGILALDVGGGPLDHHGKDLCVSEIVARHLGVENDPSIARMLQYARRDDREGKGTISTDPIDRAFGLSGLISSLNKIYSSDPQKVVDTALPLLHAQYSAAREHHVELPQDIAHKKTIGDYEEIWVEQGGKKFKISFVVSDKPSMPTFLRSQQGPRADVIVQKSEKTNHVCILSRQERNIDLSKAAALIRLREGQLVNRDLGNDALILGKFGRLDEVPHWYFDPATNSLLNGGSHNTAVEESRIPWPEMKKIVHTGLAIGGSVSSSITPAKKTHASYYLSIAIPHPKALEIVASLGASENVKIHNSNNLHITLEYLGPRTPEAVSKIIESVSRVISQKRAFEIELRDTHLESGSPEGYNHAWYLRVPDHEVELHDLRHEIIKEMGVEPKPKMFHVTLATKLDKEEVPDDAVKFFEPFELTIPITEIILMENTLINGRRVYRPHTTFPLS